MKKKYFMLRRALWMAIPALLVSLSFSAKAQVHKIPNTVPDSLEHFIENTTYWDPGDTIMLSSSGQYVINGTIDIFQEVTIMGDPDLPVRPLAVLYDNGFRPKEDSISITIKGIDFDGYDPVEDEYASYILRFDQAGFSNYKNIRIEDSEAYNFVGGIQLYKNQGTLYDTVIVNNVVWHDFSSEGIDPRINATDYMAITNSTFYNIGNTFLKNPYFANPADGRPDTINQKIVIDHNTFFNIGQILLQVNDPKDGSIDLEFTNNIVSTLTDSLTGRPFRLDPTAGNFTISHSNFHSFESSRDEGKYNLDTTAKQANVDTSNLYAIYPDFKDTADYDFLLPESSVLMFAGTDGGAIGDPRWVPQVGVTIRPLTAVVVEGFDTQLEADVVFSEGTDLSLTWSVINGTGEATIDESTGLLHPEAAGDITVIATSNYNTAAKDSLEIAINSRTYVSGINISGIDDEDMPSDSIGNVGGTLRLVATVLPGGANVKDITWSISDESIATIAVTGDFTATVTAVKSGDVTVTVTSEYTEDGTPVTGELNVKVRGQIPVEELEVSAEGGENMVRVGRTLQMIATASPADAEYPDVTWSVNLAGLAEIDPETGVLTGLMEGEVIVIATSVYYDVADSLEVTVAAPLGLEPAANLVEVYPNPVSDLININTKSLAEVTINNLSGQVVLSRMIDRKGVIDLAGLRAGIYILKVRSEDQFQSIKIIKQ